MIVLFYQYPKISSLDFLEYSWIKLYFYIWNKRSRKTLFHSLMVLGNVLSWINTFIYPNRPNEEINYKSLLVFKIQPYCPIFLFLPIWNCFVRCPKPVQSMLHTFNNCRHFLQFINVFHQLYRPNTKVIVYF